MKNTARFVAVIFTMVLSFSAMAKGQFDEAQRAMMDSQWGRAEQLLKAYQEKDYNNGKGHYLLAQVYEQTRRYAEAQDQLDIAKKVAPDGRWAKADQADAMANRLSVKLAANNPQPRTQPRERTRVADEPRVAYTPPARQTPVANTTPAPTTNVAPQQSSGGHGFMIFLVFLLVAAGGGLGIYYYLGRRTEKEAEERLDAGRRALQATAVDMQARVTAIRDALKFQNKAGSELGLSIDGIASSLNTNANALRDRAIDSNTLSRARSNLDTLEAQLSRAEGRLARKDFDAAKAAPAPTPAPEPVRAAPAPTPAPYQPTSTTPPSPRYAAPTPAPAPVHQPQVVHHHHETIVHDNSSSDLLTAVVIADAMSNSRHEDERRREREREYERDRQRERDREEERRAEQRREDQRQRDREEREEQNRRDRQDEEDRRSSRSAPAMDFGGDDDSGSSSSSPSMDMGGDDD
jgi:tetratricopeptide (TPR) repeat protein